MKEIGFKSKLVSSKFSRLGKQEEFNVLLLYLNESEEAS